MSVQVQELKRCEHGHALVAINEGVISCQAEHEGRGLSFDGGMELNLGKAGLGLGESRIR